VPSVCNVVQFILRIPVLETTCFGLTGHLQRYRLLWLRILLLTALSCGFLSPVVVAESLTVTTYTPEDDQVDRNM
jgi:hypothetical protein